MRTIRLLCLILLFVAVFLGLKVHASENSNSSVNIDEKDAEVIKDLDLLQNWDVIQDERSFEQDDTEYPVATGERNGQ